MQLAAAPGSGDQQSLSGASGAAATGSKPGAGGPGDQSW